MNTTGGQETVALNINEMPSHTHTANVSDPGHFHNLEDGVGAGSGVWWGVNNGSGRERPPTNTVKTGISVSNNYTGGNLAHENMPPFYVLTYIMKL
jgi:microcystin-dependent protein